jgi:hypothetical protein
MDGRAKLVFWISRSGTVLNCGGTAQPTQKLTFLTFHVKNLRLTLYAYFSLQQKDAQVEALLPKQFRTVQRISCSCTVLDWEPSWQLIPTPAYGDCAMCRSLTSTLDQLQRRSAQLGVPLPGLPGG